MNSQLNREKVKAMLGLTLEATRVYREAKAEGERECKLKMVPKLLARGLNVEEVAGIVELPFEEIRQIAQQQA